jgi:hypothetical protein
MEATQRKKAVHPCCEKDHIQRHNEQAATPPEIVDMDVESSELERS